MFVKIVKSASYVKMEPMYSSSSLKCRQHQKLVSQFFYWLLKLIKFSNESNGIDSSYSFYGYHIFESLHRSSHCTSFQHLTAHNERQLRI